MARIPARLAGSTWTDLTDVRPMLVVPVGSVEQHGPHLPLDTDARIACAVARGAVARAAGAVLAPPVTYGASGEHEGFPGTVSIGQDALRLVLIELGRSATRWTDRIVFVNGHGGNTRPLLAAVRLLREEGRDVAWFPCAFPRADAHAGVTETSVLLAIAPDAVRARRIEPGCTAPLTEIMDRLQREGTAAVAPNGILGDPSGSTAEHGAALVAELTDALAIGLAQWRVDDAGRLR